MVGIAGPGDPLVNAPTFVTMRKIHWEYPDLTLCVSTNGLLLSDRLEQLLSSGVRSLTVTINAVTPETAENIYSWVIYQGRRYEGREAAELLLRNQWQGLQSAIEAGLITKVNTVFIPGVNDAEIPLIAERAGKLGADIMNIMPLIPQAEFADLKRPSHAELTRMRESMPSLYQADDPLQAMPGGRLRHPGRGQGHGARSADDQDRGRIY